jgi:hypothetical protein
MEIEGRRYTAEQLAVIEEKYRDDLMDIRSDRRTIARNEKALAVKLKADLETACPFLRDPSDARTQQVRSILERYPVLDRMPIGQSLVVDALMFRALMAKQAASKSPSKPARTPPPAPAKPAAAPAKVDASRAAQADASKRLIETGSRNALADLLRARGGS